MRDDPANPTAGGIRAARPRRSGFDGSRSIALVLYDGFTPFDLGVACEVFGDDR